MVCIQHGDKLTAMIGLCNAYICPTPKIQPNTAEIHHSFLFVFFYQNPQLTKRFDRFGLVV